VKPTNKIALITGGSRGLGRNTAINLARNGTNVILTYHSNQKEADSAVAEIIALGQKAVAIQLDTGNVAAFDDFVNSVGQALAGVGTERFD
jgi:NAD(P)-dependent dehydrogenase (short-subunit alcohol dehydrogenase family)